MRELRCKDSTDVDGRYIRVRTDLSDCLYNKNFNYMFNIIDF